MLFSKSLRIYLIVQIVCFQFIAAQHTPIKTVAHRGGVNWGPENTISTFLIAAQKGVNYVEMDVRQTKDGEFVLMHDRNVSRTTNGNGMVSELTLEEIKKLDAGSWYSSGFKNEPVPTLREVLRAIDGKILPDLDFKAGDPKALVQLLEEEGYLDGRPLTLYSGNHELISGIQALTDKILVRPGIKSSYEELATSLNPPIVNLSWRKFTPKLQQQINNDGRQTFVNCLFFSNRKRPIRKAIQRGADFIQTDKVDYLLKKLNK
jgi:glycerophosphoryl diester phosphodiesterase